MFESFDYLFKSKLFWVSAVLVIIYVYFKTVVYSYWKRLGVPCDKFTIPFGIFDSRSFLGKITLGNVFKESYNRFKKYPYHGVYTFHTTQLMINDPELIKQILVKDFANFCDRGLYFNDKVDPISGHLFFMNGDRWRTLRAKLSPTFTSGKLKQIFPILQEIGNEMINVADEALVKTDILELKDLIARYTTDTIFSLAFGLDSKTLRNPNSEFRIYGNKSVDSSILRSSIGLFAPSILDALRIPLTTSEVSKYFIKLFDIMVDERRSSSTKRKDFLNMLIELMDKEQVFGKDDSNDLVAQGISKESASKRLEMLEAAANAFVFFVAGFETSSSVATHCIYELALHPEVQEKVHEEIDDFLQNTNELTYDNLIQLEYLEMAFYEAMRKHPSVPVLNRVCINNYQVPNSDLVLQKGQKILISVSGLHSDPDIFPEPDKFDPTRFSKENVEARHPFVYLPFGDGPRICIGKRLGVLQSKIALFSLLSKYKFSVCEKTPIPNHYSTKTLLQTPRDGIYLRAEKRKMK